MPPSARTRSGFTLVELLIVVALLGILSAMAVPSLRTERRGSTTSTLRSNVTQVQMVLEVQKQKLATGSYPPALQPQWFVSGILPPHPDKLADVPSVEVVRIAGAKHPADKIVHEGSAGAYWYNVANGVFRARVKEQATMVETLSYYNDVNLSALGSLADTVDAGSGGGSSSSAPASSSGGAGGAAAPVGRGH